MKEGDKLPLLVGAGAGLLLLVHLARRSGASSAPPSTVDVPDGAVPDGGVTDLPIPTDGSRSPPAPAALIARLSANTPQGLRARQVFYLQATIYSYTGEFNHLDGVLNDVTWMDINRIRHSAWYPTNTTWSDETIMQTLVAVLVPELAPGAVPAINMLPFRLPQSLIDRINRENADRLMYRTLPLQVQPL